MKGLSRRFVNHKGKAYDVKKKKVKEQTSVGFFDLWRYASRAERLATGAAVALSLGCSVGMISAVVVYGELTSLFVERHRAATTTSHGHILALFGGGELLEEGDRAEHMEALVRDAVAFAVASVAIMALQLSTAASAVWLANWAAGNMVRRLRGRLLGAVLRQEVAFFDTNTSMNFAATLTEEMEKLRAGTGEHVAMTSYLGGTAAVGGALALAYGWQLTLSALAVVPLSLLVATTVAKYQTRWSSAEVVAYGVAGRAAEEALAAVRTVRAFAGEEREVHRYKESLRGASSAARRRGLWAAAGAGLGALLTYSLNAVVFAYGAALCVRDAALPAAQQQYHPGVMVIVLFCTFMGAQNISMCLPHLEVFSAARGAATSLFPLLERRSRIDALQDKGTRPERFQGDIVFDNLYFNYPSRPDVKVLRGLSLRVRAGETVALVGGSGCGKSTVLQLLQRLYEPQAGAIAVDGHRLPDLHLHHFRRSIGVVGQEPVLFSGTIRENIALGEDDVTHDQIVAAAKAAHAHQFISKLADGYDTVLGERCALSGGQKQRVALARALLRDPPLLLLDEPTSALDPAAERQVQAALDAASAGRTTLVVSHRLATIVNATRIVYVEQGAVLEQGSHAELLQLRGAYWRLVQDDLTHRSIAKSVPVAGEGAARDGGDPAGADDDDDVVPVADCRGQLQRAAAGRKESTCSELGVRSSVRLGVAPHLVLPTPPDVTHPPELSEGTDEEPGGGVSGWALLKLNGPEWPLLLSGGAASFLVGATMPTFALLFSKLYGMFAWSDREAILQQSRVYAGAFAAVAALCGLGNLVHTWMFNAAGSRLTDRLRELTFRSFLAQEQGWFDEPRNAVGALCARLAADCAAVQGATGSRLGTVVQGVSTMVLGVALAMVYSWKMTLVSLISVPFVIGGICLEGWVTRRAEARERRALERASQLATEAVSNVRTVHSLGVERTILRRYEAALVQAGRGAAAARAARGLVYGLCLCAPTFGYAISLAYGGYLIAREDLQYEYVILVSEALVYGAWMLAEALSFAPSFAAARRAGHRIVAQLARQPRIVTEPTAVDDPAWVASGEVQLTAVQFEYPSRRGVPVLRGLSLAVEPGRTVALVGASGSGKSTVLQLLLRSYDPATGTVSVGGRDVKRDLSLRSLRAQLGLVQQEPVLFARSLRDNIAYGSPRDVPMDEIIAAARHANVHSFIASLPNGYETVLGSGGCSLSGGQKQRVCIARALVRDPRVLLLDEATSALDAASEKTVQAALEAASRGRTTITIAHRLATVRHADTICVINKGVVAESGSHEELVRRRGLYWELWQQQAAPAT